MAKAFANEPITIFGDGEQTRDFIFVKDIVAALVFAAITPDLPGVFNVGYGGSITVNQLAEEIVKAAGSSSEIQHLPERAGDVKHSRASIDKLLGVGFQHVSTFEEGIRQTLEFFRDRG